MTDAAMVTAAEAQALTEEARALVTGQGAFASLDIAIRLAARRGDDFVSVPSKMSDEQKTALTAAGFVIHSDVRWASTRIRWDHL